MSQHSAVYVSGEFSEPMTAQHNFTNQFDLDNPQMAASSYARIMHEHTKHQLSTATNSARRRTEGITSQTALTPESSNDSVSSTDS